MPLSLFGDELTRIKMKGLDKRKFPSRLLSREYRKAENTQAVLDQAKRAKAILDDQPEYIRLAALG